MRKKACILAAALLAALAVTGCCSLYNLEVGPCPKSQPDTMRVFGGVRKHIEMWAAPDTLFGQEDHEKSSIMLVAMSVALPILDLPLCCAVDVLTLPITATCACGRWLRQSDGQSPADSSIMKFWSAEGAMPDREP
jgi:hypothetical protein